MYEYLREENFYEKNKNLNHFNLKNFVLFSLSCLHRFKL